MTVVYRLVFPPGQEIKEGSKPATPPADARQLAGAVARQPRTLPQSVRPGRVRLPTRKAEARSVGRIFAENEDVQWMRRALAEAARGLGSVEPNPLVGAVVVRDGQLVGAGHHERFGGPHAEINALAMAGDVAHAGRRSTSRSSRVAISARRLRAPMRFSPPGSPAWSWR